MTIRYTLIAGPGATLLNARGQVLARKNGRAGDEVELAVPQAELAGANDLTLSVTESPTVAVKIILRVR